MDILEGLRSGKRRALARGITLVESHRGQHQLAAQRLVAELMPESGKSLRIGISGSPGVGKSTFIENFGLRMIAEGYKIAVLAVDPSSPKTKGSILGDKTRMQSLSVHPNAFIRPSPAGTTLGGVARRTRESIILCEAAGYDLILIETVGVGQSEIAVAGMVDIFLFLQLPGAGDDLQGIKKGILELADLILINKADRKTLQAAKRAKVDLDLALNLLYKSNHSERPEVLLISALEGLGFDEFLQSLKAKELTRQQSGALAARRRQQAVEWFHSETRSLAYEALLDDEQRQRHYQELERQVEEQTLTATAAARKFLQEYLPYDRV